ncbi:PREDICTED: WD repeat-containing protein 7-like [Priapulus caudatus]|uniref:WD repeat-containing protein 7-like n=1 Tax=Priapulus caudatus TaxID=37621 RepID=A0ABM1FBH1_PRICU|nr:PREDICTED: WD repeat-containing protein 7-like [Priapulus caudatus]
MSITRDHRACSRTDSTRRYTSTTDEPHLIFSLSSKVAPDWISALTILHPLRRQDDVVVALSNSGTAKVWTLTGQESKSSDPMYEDESKQIRCLNAVSLVCCQYNQRTALVVCSKYFQVYDAGDFSLLSAMGCPVNERWAGGEFLATDRIIVWTTEGKGYLFKLASNCVADHKDFRSRVGHLAETDQLPMLYCVAEPADERVNWPPFRVLLGHTGKVTCLLHPHQENARYEMHQLVSGGVDFSVCLWDMYSGTLLHRFCIHGGEVTQLMATPSNCSLNIQLEMQLEMQLEGIEGSLKAYSLKCHLDRVVHGLVAEDILAACDEGLGAAADDTPTTSSQNLIMAVRRRNVAAIRTVAQRNLQQGIGMAQTPVLVNQEVSKDKSYPLQIQGLRTNPRDPDAHVLFFDIERKRRSYREAARQQQQQQGGDEAEENVFLVHQAQIKQGWSLLAALHCVLLPELVGLKHYKVPLLHMLARRWQDRCLEVREAAQALLLAELRRIGPEGRKMLVEDWAPYLPTYVDPRVSLIQEGGQAATDDDSYDSQDQNNLGGVSPKFNSRQKQATAIVMLGVIGAEFGQEIEANKNKPLEHQMRRKAVEGFSQGNYSLARHTSKALTFLLLSPPINRLPAHTPIRRGAIDLIGRGFTVWEPHLDESAVLLGLLELCCDADKLLRGISLGLPLSPAADSCRTARHSLSLIATARPAAFITTMAKEVARYVAMAASAPAQNANLGSHVLVKSKPEILRVVELLIDKLQMDVIDLLIEVVDIVIHCLDISQVRAKGLGEVFPSITRDTKQRKEHIAAHGGPITAVSFSPDGKYVCSYSLEESKLCFWQAATSLFGMGSSQVKCVRSYNTVPISPHVSTNPLRLVKLVWVSSKTVIVLVADGTEYKYNI